MPLGITWPIGERLAFRHRRGEVAAVVEPAGLRLVREAADQVLAAQFRWVELHLAGGLIDQTLDDIDGLRTASAAVGDRRRGIRQNEAARHRQRRNVVDG